MPRCHFAYRSALPDFFWLRRHRSSRAKSGGTTVAATLRRGSILKVGETWYWFGEDRTEENGQPSKPRERWIACYASNDRMHWEGALRWPTSLDAT
jgi:hypothetical protein